MEQKELHAAEVMGLESEYGAEIVCAVLSNRAMMPGFSLVCFDLRKRPDPVFLIWRVLGLLGVI
jgi:hypothetical protein